MIRDKQLSYTLIKKEEASGKDIDRMYQLMQAHYTHVTNSIFRKDLSRKQFIGLIRDTENHIQGFTTFAVNPKQSGGKEYHILFSGDTIIERDYWGSQIMMKGWCMSTGAIIASDRRKNWYWYLLSKGHRTYLYLPLFFHTYYPSLAPCPDRDKLFLIADKVSRTMYGEEWNPDLGVIQFRENRGAMRKELYASESKKKKNRHVEFFLEKNPGFSQGDELVCIAPISVQNMKRSAKDYLLEGMKRPLDINELLR